eukprot:581895-Pyramimonas_sp.AAC.1
MALDERRHLRLRGVSLPRHLHRATTYHARGEGIYPERRPIARWAGARTRFNRRPIVKRKSAYTWSGSHSHEGRGHIGRSG